MHSSTASSRTTRSLPDQCGNIAINCSLDGTIITTSSIVLHRQLRTTRHSASGDSIASVALVTTSPLRMLSATPGRSNYANDRYRSPHSRPLIVVIWTAYRRRPSDANVSQPYSALASRPKCSHSHRSVHSDHRIFITRSSQ